MNSVNLIGYLTRDPEVRYTQSNMAVATLSIAINRGKDKNGQDKGADFPRVIVFGSQAENCQKYLSKGKRIGVTGRIQTDSYEREDGSKVYTTDVIASRVEFLSPSGQQGGQPQGPQTYQQARPQQTQMQQPDFTPIPDDNIPF
mgnify:CR=1 FL=1|jgi:single-strand DNA-binding protein